MQTKKSTSMRSGFTLIELLVVITVITLLVAILMPMLAVAREASLRSRCGNNLRQFASVCLIYEQDFKAFPAGDRALTCQIRIGHVTLRTAYGLPVGVVTCPSGTQESIITSQWGNNSGSPIIYYEYFAGDGGGTTTNQRKWDGWDGTLSVAWYLAYLGLRPVPSVDKSYWPSKHPLSTDIANMWELNVSALRPLRSNHPTKTADGIDRNNDGTGRNIAFLDGHVEWHNFEPGFSWRFGGDTNERFWWTPTWSLSGKYLGVQKDSEFSWTGP